MRVSRLVCSLAVTVSLTGAHGTPAQTARHHALLIGIDDYVVVRDLHGCSNDVERFKSTLVGKFGFDAANIVTIKNEQATRQRILDEFEALVTRTSPGDAVVVHYSGHGSRVQDVTGDEEDGWDETIVPHDSRQAGIFDITDDEINQVLSRLTAKTTNVSVIMDSCHSGSATRGGADVRRIPDDERKPPAPSGAISRAAEGADDFRQKDAAYVLITGSRPNELSNEFDVDGVRHGALTHFLTRTLLAAPAGATYRSIMETVAFNVSNTFPSQHPQLEGAGDRVIFGVTQTLAAPYLLVNPAPSGALVEGGTVHGLAAGSELDVYPPGTLDFDTKPIARIRLKSGIEALQSEAEIVTGGPIPSAARAVIRSRTYSDAKLRVYLGQPETARMTEVRTELAKFPGFEIVTDEAKADLRLRHERNLIFMASADLVPLSPPLSADAPDAVRRTVERATAWMRWFAVLRLQNPDGLLPVAIKAGDGSKTRFTSGDRVEFTIANLSTEPAYLTLLNLDADGAITSLSTAQDRTDAIPPNGTRRRTIRFETPAGRAFVADVVKAVLTTTPLDPALFTQAAARSADPAPPRRNSPLDRLILLTGTGRSRSATVVESASWGTAASRVEVWQSAVTEPVQPSGLPVTPRVDGFVLHFPEGSRATPETVASRGVAECPSGGPQPDECWEIRAMGPSSSSIEVRSAGRRAASRAPVSLGAAWDEAARLRRVTGAEVVEPVFEVSLDDQAVDPATRSGGGTPDKEAATRDAEWSLKHANIFAARAQLRALNRPQDAEATGIIVAHPDTGYRQHPEFWSADIAKSAVMYDSGWSFVEDNERPLDPLDDSGRLANPGHGTKAGSVIVSPPGKQWTGGSATEFVTGVAPGARLVPLRVHTSVVHFNPSRLAQAIGYAAEPDGVKIRLPQGDGISVVSISMGGLPSFGLYKAVRQAQRKGVIVIAAAGNQVRTVVWPARFDDAIAVAATNVECHTWPGSSRGGAVDIAAPGESVWHASVGADGALGAAMGQGTTYATATTAGIAALWVAKHRGTPLFEKLKADGRLTDAFRAAVQKTSWRPGAAGSAAPPAGVTCASGATWDAGKYGAGIVDADRLLRETLVEPPVSRSLDVEPLHPLFESLFEVDVTSEVAAERLAALFPSADLALRKSLEAELATLYALDSEVQAAVQRLTTSAAPDQSDYAAVRAVLQQKDVSTAMAAAARVSP